MVSTGRLLGLALLVVVVILTTDNAQAVVFDNETAGYWIDVISPRGIRLVLRWYCLFSRRMREVNETLNWVEQTLDNHYSSANMPNLTAYAYERADTLRNKTAQAEALALDKNLTDDGDGLIAFMKTNKVSQITNVGGAFNPSLRSDGTFVVPEPGLYQVLVRTGPGTGGLNVMRNTNVTLTTIPSTGYYDVRTRVRLVHLNHNDQIFYTGTDPIIFSVIKLRIQYLMPPTPH